MVVGVSVSWCDGVQFFSILMFQYFIMSVFQCCFGASVLYCSVLVFECFGVLVFWMFWHLGRHFSALVLCELVLHCFDASMLGTSLLWCFLDLVLCFDIRCFRFQSSSFLVVWCFSVLMF